MKIEISNVSRSLGSYNSTALFVAVVLLCIVVDYLIILFPVTADISLFSVLLNVDTTSPILLAINSILNTIFYGLYFLIISELTIMIGKVMGLVFQRKLVLNAVIIAECVFVVDKLLHLVVGNVASSYDGNKLLSLNSLFGTNSDHSSITFLLNHINVFPILYACLIGYALMLNYSLKRSQAIKLMFLSYGLLYIVTSAIRFIPLSYLPS
ncbi:MAG: hypothetical protein AAF149_06935 [Bacteroidota bacterium]